MPPEVGEVERKIRFHRVAATNPKNQVDLAAVVDELRPMLKDRGEAGDVVDLKKGGVAAWLIRAKAPTRFRLARLRDTELPGQFSRKTGMESDLILPDDESLSESTHFVIFSNNTIGHDFHRGGATIFEFLQFLRAKLPDLPPLRADVLLKEDMVKELAALGRVTALRVRMDISQVQQLKEASPTLSDSLQRLLIATQMPELELTLMSRDAVKTPVLRELKKKLGAFLEVLSRKQDKLQVSGYPGETYDEEAEKIDLDLLNEKLTYTCTVRTTTARSRRVIADPIYQQIEAAYNALKSDIDRAVAVSAEE